MSALTLTAAAFLYPCGASRGLIKKIDQNNVYVSMLILLQDIPTRYPGFTGLRSFYALVVPPSLLVADSNA